MFWDAKAWHAFATGILPHGVLEYSAILIGGAAGFVLCMLCRPSRGRVPEELARKGKEAPLLLFGVVPLMSVARSSRRRGAGCRCDHQPNLKLWIAAVVGLLFLVYTLLIGWTAPRWQETAP